MDAEQTQPIHQVQRLRRRIAEARRAGFAVRTEWLGGEAGGGCEFAGRRWIFIDLSLPIADQRAQLEEALRAEPGGVADAAM